MAKTCYRDFPYVCLHHPPPRLRFPLVWLESYFCCIVVVVVDVVVVVVVAGLLPEYLEAEYRLPDYEYCSSYD